MDEPRFDVASGLIPAVIQDHETDEVLMVGYLNREAWELTLREGRVHYYSRKKKRIWLKGEQSGNYQIVKQVLLNCDNTGLLIRAEQIGGACDQGLRSCFDKTLEGGKFEPTGVRVFDPLDAYGEDYAEGIVLGIPSGSLADTTFQLLELAGYEVNRVSERSYHPTIGNDSTLGLFMCRPQELPGFVAQGSLDAAVTGMDMIEEAGVSLRDVCDLGYNKLGLGSVAIALAVPQELAFESLHALEGKRVATAYPNITQRHLRERGISVQIVCSLGATEGKVPLVADAIVELVETGTTLQCNRLKPVLKLMETTVHLVTTNSIWGYTWKRRSLEALAERLENAAAKLPRNPKKPVEFAALH